MRDTPDLGGRTSHPERPPPARDESTSDERELNKRWRDRRSASG
jgi:hypothetical protein